MADTKFQRPSTSKQTNSDSGQQAQSESQSGTRPTSRVDHPEGKRQYMDKDQRIDHPAGKQQYMDKERPNSRIDQPGRPVEKNPVPEIKDPSSVKSTLKLTVKTIKSDKDNVLLQVLGTNYVGKKLPFSVSYNSRAYANGLDDAWRLVKLGATVELKKIVTIEFPIY